jgi:uncharacterized membrane protein (UPF0127 family)
VAAAQSISKAYVFNRSRNAFISSELRRADTHWSRLLGLMGTSPKNFPHGSGLWIVPCQGVHTMWMRYPIDVLYLDENKTVLYIEENVQPWRIPPMHFDTASVIEVRSPAVMTSGTCVGDILEIGGFEND